VKNFFDDWMLNANCIEAAMATSLTVEHGFTNIQFVALAADAMEAGTSTSRTCCRDPDRRGASRALGSRRSKC